MREIKVENLVRISKAKARKLWNEGGEIALTPCNLSPVSPWGSAKLISAPEFIKLGYDTDFDAIVATHEYYNCCNSETGRYTAFYTKEVA